MPKNASKSSRILLASSAIFLLWTGGLEAAPKELLVHWTVPLLTEHKETTVAPYVFDGTAVMHYEVTAGQLPKGLVLDPTTGTISGTPQAFGETDITITATTSDHRSRSAEVNFVVIYDV
jgi:hypothetical protein